MCQYFFQTLYSESILVEKVELRGEDTGARVFPGFSRVKNENKLDSCTLRIHSGGQAKYTKAKSPAICPRFAKNDLQGFENNLELSEP